MASDLELGLKSIDPDHVGEVADAILGPVGGPYHSSETANQITTQEELATRFPGIDKIAEAVFERSFPNIETAQVQAHMRQQFPDLTDSEIIAITVLQAYSAVLGHYATTDSFRDSVEGS